MPLHNILMLHKNFAGQKNFQRLLCIGGASVRSKWHLPGRKLLN